MKQESKNITVGFLGEDIACRFLKAKGYLVTERNYRKKQGEIDIIAKKNSVIHFFEVKTVSCEIGKSASELKNNDVYRPEDNVHSYKLKRLADTISIFLIDRNLVDVEWTFNVVTVLLDRKNKKAKVSLLDDLVF